MTGMLKTAVSGAATGGWGAVLQFVWNNKAAISLSIVVIVLGIMYGCERSSLSTVTAEKAAVVEKLADSAKALEAANTTIAGLRVDVKVAQDETSKRVAELEIVKKMLHAKLDFDNETAEIKAKADDLLAQWQKETDPRKKADLEAAYWNTAFGIKTRIDTKCTAGVTYCVKPVAPTIFGVNPPTIKPVVIKPAMPPK